MKKKHVGRLEIVTLPAYSSKKIIAKSDTGAYSAALHCAAIKLIADKQGQKTLCFRPIGRSFALQRSAVYSRKNVRSSNGQSERRYFVHTKIFLDGQLYDIEFGLTDRSAMKWPVLLGRKFLRLHKMVVDVDKPRTTRALVKELQKQ